MPGHKLHPPCIRPFSATGAPHSGLTTCNLEVPYCCCVHPSFHYCSKRGAVQSPRVPFTVQYNHRYYKTCAHSIFTTVYFHFHPSIHESTLLTTLSLLLPHYQHTRCISSHAFCPFVDVEVGGFDPLCRIAYTSLEMHKIRSVHTQR